MFVAKLFAILHHCLTCLGHLGRHDTDSIVSIFCCTAQGDQGKYKCVTVMCYCHRHYRTNLCQCKYSLKQSINVLCPWLCQIIFAAATVAVSGVFANVNDPLESK
jgi:hypothetical protein